MSLNERFIMHVETLIPCLELVFITPTTQSDSSSHTSNQSSICASTSDTESHSEFHSIEGFIQSHDTINTVFDVVQSSECSSLESLPEHSFPDNDLNDLRKRITCSESKMLATRDCTPSIPTFRVPQPPDCLPIITETLHRDSLIQDSGYSDTSSSDVSGGITGIYEENNNTIYGGIKPTSLIVNNITDDLKLALSLETDSANDLDRLKQLAIRLKLQTRRESYNSWQENIAKRSSCNTNHSKSRDETHNATTMKPDTTQNRMHPCKTLGAALNFIRNELREIREMDESLARQFVSLRAEIQSLRLQLSTDTVEEMVDEATWTLEDKAEYDKISDLPHILDKSPLSTIGITKMNLESRRFSVF